MNASINFKAVFDAIPHATLLLSRDLTILRANVAALRLARRRHSELAGRNILEVFPGDDKDRSRNTAGFFGEAVERVMATQRSEALPVFRYALQRGAPSDGAFDEHFFTGTLTPVFDMGRLCCVCYNVVEVTEIELLKQRLRDSDAARIGLLPPQADEQAVQAEWLRLRHLFDHAPGIVAFVRGQQHVFEMANRNSYQLLGHRPIIGKPLRQALPELANQELGALLDEAYQCGRPVVRQAMPVLLQRHPDTPLVQAYADFVFQPILDATGTVTGVFIQGHEVTEQVHAQEELRVREERWMRALDAAGDAVWDCDPQTGRIVYSDNWCAMLGYGANEVGEHIYDWRKLWHPDDEPQVWDAIMRCLDGREQSMSAEFRIRCKDGNWKWILGRGAVISRDSEGRPLRLIGTNIDISGKKQSEHEIWRRANFDLLTDLPNRSLFRDRLEHEVEHSRRTGQPMGLLFIDLDRFKETNDWLGHNAGDQLLRQAAVRIGGCVRKSDTVARLGGDEFTVIVSELDHAARAEQVAQKILDELARPFRICDEVVELSASIGITLFPADANDPEDLIRHADQAMYVAKNAGRKQYRFFTRSMQEMAARRRVLTGELREAVRKSQLQLHLQPIIDLRDGCIAKAEALVRWQHPYKGLLAPTEFITLAEETGLIHEIGDWVFSQGVYWSRRWSEKLGRTFQIGVNKSPAQFMAHANGIDWIGLLKAQGLPGKSISVEITEGLLLNASDSVAGELLNLRDAGVQVAIDDFGTGYSSMAYLKKFDVDYLKIDQSFVRDTAPNGSARTIAETIIVMAHKLDLKVIAEGVETREQHDWLKQAGCDYAQGYLFSRPVPPPEFERLLGEQCVA